MCSKIFLWCIIYNKVCLINFRLYLCVATFLYFSRFLFLFLGFTAVSSSNSYKKNFRWTLRLSILVWFIMIVYRIEKRFMRLPSWCLSLFFFTSRLLSKVNLFELEFLSFSFSLLVWSWHTSYPFCDITELTGGVHTINYINQKPCQV